jgi:hypothetical protein
MTRQEQRAYWRARLAKQAASGLSVRAWCAREGVSYTSLMRWRRRLSVGPVETPLTLVRVTEPCAVSGALVITVGAARIEVTRDFDAALLKRVVCALGS